MCLYRPEKEGGCSTTQNTAQRVAPHRTRTRTRRMIEKAPLADLPPAQTRHRSSPTSVCDVRGCTTRAAPPFATAKGVLEYYDGAAAKRAELAADTEHAHLACGVLHDVIRQYLPEFPKHCPTLCREAYPTAKDSVVCGYIMVQLSPKCHSEHVQLLLTLIEDPNFDSYVYHSCFLIQMCNATSVLKSWNGWNATPCGWQGPAMCVPRTILLDFVSYVFDYFCTNLWCNIHPSFARTMAMSALNIHNDDAGYAGAKANLETWCGLRESFVGTKTLLTLLQDPAFDSMIFMARPQWLEQEVGMAEEVVRQWDRTCPSFNVPRT